MLVVFFGGGGELLAAFFKGLRPGVRFLHRTPPAFMVRPGSCQQPWWPLAPPATVSSPYSAFFAATSFWDLEPFAGPFLYLSSYGISSSFASSLELRIPGERATWNNWSSQCPLSPCLVLCTKRRKQAAAQGWARAEDRIPDRCAFHFPGRWNTS